METYYKDKQDQEKEAKQLAKMAKFKHDKARDAEATLSMESVEDDGKKNDKEPWRTNDEEEEDKELTKEELGSLIYHHLKSN